LPKPFQKSHFNKRIVFFDTLVYKKISNFAVLL